MATVLESESESGSSSRSATLADANAPSAESRPAETKPAVVPLLPAEIDVPLAPPPFNPLPDAADRDDLEGPASETSPLLASRDYGRPAAAAAPSAKLPPGSKGQSRPSIVDISPVRFYVIMTMVCIQLFISSFDTTIMSSSHPVITSYFRASHLAPWLSTAFSLASISMNSVVVALADPVGRFGLMLTSGVLFALSTIWCACAQSMLSFVIARAVCGAAVVGWGVLGNILLADLVSIENRGLWQAATNLAWGSGGAAGAAMGGTMADLLGWRWEFGIQVPFIIALTLAGLAIPRDLGRAEGEARKTLREAMRTFDYMGCILVALSTSCLVLLASLGGNILPWTHPLIIALGVFCIVFGVGFVRAESKAAKPVYPLDVMTRMPLRNIFGATVLFSMCINGLYFNIPLYFQTVLGNSATVSGLRLMVPLLMNMVFGISSSMGVRQLGRLSPFLNAAPPCLAVGTLLACLYAPGWPEWAYLASLLPVGASAGLFFPPSSIASVAYADRKDHPATAGLTCLTRSLGTVMGVAGFGLVTQNALRHYLFVFVDGPRKWEVVEQVRRSVEAVRHLEEPYLGQVLRSYQATLRVTFACILVLVLSLVPILASTKLARISKRR